MKKDKVNIDNSNAKTKKRWSFGKCMKDPSQRVTLENDSTRIRSCMSTSEKEQNKHAIAVSAQAAVAIASLTSDGRDTLFSGREKWAATKIQSVYRGHLAENALRHLRGLVKFQALVKGFIVRKRAAVTLYHFKVQREIHHQISTAPRVLKGLVKFQALVRGFLVRKRVAATLYSMQALLRAQLVVRSQRAELAVRYQFAGQPNIRHGKSTLSSLL
ncbi:IQ-DOMAIN 31-like protein [Tanacetum coccineum]